MISGIPSDDELRSLFKDVSLFDIHAESPTQIYTFQNDTVDSLLDFIGRLEISVVFAERIYVCKDDLKIRNEMFQGLKLDIIGGVQFDSHRFNRDLESMDLSSPVELRLFALYEGKAFGVRFVDEGLDSLRKVKPEQRVEMFAEERRNKLKDQNIITAKKEDPMIERFSEVLVLDRLYRNLRDDYERFNYVIKIARRPGNDNLKKAILKDDGSGFNNDRIRQVVALTMRKTDPNSGDTVQMVFGKD